MDDKELKELFQTEEPEEKESKEVKEVKKEVKEQEATTQPDFPISKKNMILIISGAVFIILILSFLTLPMFRIQTITIEGNYVISNEDILSVSGIDSGSHVYFHNYSAIENLITDMSPYIKDTDISIKLPSQIVIKVNERAKVAYVRVPDGYAAIDSEGVIVELETGSNLEKPKPLICGIEVSDAVIGLNSGVTNNDMYNRAIVVLGAILMADRNMASDDYSIFENVYELRLIPGGEIFLTIKIPNGNMLQVKLSNVDGINDDMDWLLFAIEQGEFDNLPNGVMDMTGNVYIYRQY